MNNLDIRIYVKESGLLFKDVAEQMGVTPEYLSRVLRYKLKPKMRERILSAIRELKEGQ
ncbi:MAG: LacI family DNA-binding transcriptional regulator [Lachnospiraceae bacterium]|nr:LacI family DNA-binding transcriptional regulator [Lachnospiraceae bacterium]